MINYIFIDESGDLGKHSKYFIMASVVTKEPIKFRRVINKTNRIFRKQISKSNEIKGTTTPNNIIKNIFKKLKNIDYEVYIICFNKKNKNKLKFKDNNELYDLIAFELAKIIPINSPTSIVIDKSKSKKKDIFRFNSQFKYNLNNYENYPIEVSHLSSLHNKELQIADLIAWSYFQSIEHNDFDFIKLIKNKIIKEAFKD
ncbi:hypothetical protein TL18_02255 [Methanobrevibacter sp. YE315]|uniref:DUF3800 domain-containing protein n=1 Tax=Methanobrevibacter sp. YE315 TaxID=1609968 RepID=UPI000764D009|nr:DUF3800 domain-containing protein [Methanobrevibacter sp. YE315]AMD16946.1 hypothetical protein TL18_02255 [Methanobrevibacter sp. YE315]